MTPPQLLIRLLSGRTLHWLAGGLLALALAAAVVSLAGNLGLRWDPFGGQARRLARAEADAVRARESAARAAAVLEAERGLVRQAAAAAARTIAAVDGVQRLELLARGAPDASQPLPPDRLARLRAHDRELCGLAPALEGCAAAADDPAGGAAALPAGDPAARRHPGGSGGELRPARGGSGSL
ncbi:MAG: hypothetical protein ACK5WW_12035 [Brevundimonas sp.]|uniref:hypothetical protein n=1 Tax=Brevundimonas sp. TaxID=1871086 RepID=UPI0022BCFD86|nr:hypothetical protein [Brevundimonas sp.]